MLRDRYRSDEQWLLIDRVEFEAMYALLGILIPRCEEGLSQRNGKSGKRKHSLFGRNSAILPRVREQTACKAVTLINQ